MPENQTTKNVESLKNESLSSKISKDFDNFMGVNETISIQDPNNPFGIVEIEKPKPKIQPLDTKKLLELNELKEKRIITEDQFEIQKNILLDSNSTSKISSNIDSTDDSNSGGGFILFFLIIIGLVIFCAMNPWMFGGGIFFAVVGFAMFGIPVFIILGTIFFLKKIFFK